ncbi:hypothetical protein KSP40_PGU000341 [Platanthera guangdongensis]|uniref:Uncharacterized protein n=1 Tax=Platanthera guangdongensis TaxID=2320717 RepID=A0ABR2LHY5_9ASPA
MGDLLGSPRGACLTIEFASSKGVVATNNLPVGRRWVWVLGLLPGSIAWSGDVTLSCYYTCIDLRDFWVVEEELVPELAYDELENEIYNEDAIPKIVEQNFITTLPTQNDEQIVITEPFVEHTDLENFGDERTADFDGVGDDFGG